MSLDTEIAALTKSTQDLLESVMQVQRELNQKYAQVTTAIGLQYFVSQAAVDLPGTDSSIKGIQAKIEKDRPSAEVPVTIIVDSFTDTLPVQFTSANTEWQFKRSAEIHVPVGQKVFEVGAGEVTLKGVRIIYSEKSPQNVALEMTVEGAAEFRNATLINTEIGLFKGSIYTSDVIER